MGSENPWNRHGGFGFLLPTEEVHMSKREEIAPNGDKRYVRRDDKGQFKTEVDEGKSLSADAHHKAKHDAKPGQGDKGDHHRAN
jgi:hypothetical protein